MLDGADSRRKRVDEFVDRGDADIEAEPLDVIFDLRQRGVRRPPDLGRLGGKMRGLRWPLGAHDPFDLANEPPKALRLFVGALYARLGPNHVTIGRRVREN